MRAPGVTEVPRAIAVSIVDFDLAVDGTGCEAVAIAVERCRLHHYTIEKSVYS